VFAAAKRISDDLFYIAAGHARDDDDLVARTITVYKRLAESSYRNYAWLIADAQNILAGRPIPARSRAPLLGSLEQRFEAREDALSKTLTRAANRTLRNAEAHEEMRFNRERQEVILGEKRMRLDRFERRLERLIGITLALDAAYTCCAVETGTFVEVPQWLSGGEAPFAAELLTRGIVGAYGMDLVELRSNEDLVLRVEWETPDPVRALTPLCAIATIFPSSRRLVLEVGNTDDELVSVETATFQAFADASDAVKDLALFAPLYSAGIAAGRQERDLVEDVLALSIALVNTVDVPHLKIAIAVNNPQPLLVLEERLTYIAGFVRERVQMRSRATERVLKNLDDARTASFFVRRGSPGAIKRMTAALLSATRWVEGRGVRWPLI
jgi:hypothetical protein